MATRTIVLTLHITGVAGWLGASFVQLVLSPRFAKAPWATMADPEGNEFDLVSQ